MPTVTRDASLADQTSERRKELGLDARDEVWEGVEVVAPLADLEHQLIIARLTTVLEILVDWNGLGLVVAGCNVSDRAIGWEKNYRIPDIAVFLKGGVGILHETHSEGGPDFLVEVLSEDDRAAEKLPFYARNGVREAVFIRREPEWAIELYRNDGRTLVLAERSAPPDAAVIQSSVIPLRLRLVPDPAGGRPLIEAGQTGGDLQRLI